MANKEKISLKELELIKDKIDSLDDKIDSVSETLYALISITLDPPPDIEPTLDTEVATKEEPEQDTANAYGFDPGSLRPCRFEYVYIWPRRARPFWAWLDYVGRRSASGFKWTGHRWVRFGIDLRQIETFICFEYQ